MSNYAQDDKWTFNVHWTEMKKRMDRLERKVHSLEDYKRKQEEKETQRFYKNKP